MNFQSGICFGLITISRCAYNSQANQQKTSQVRYGLCDRAVPHWTVFHGLVASVDIVGLQPVNLESQLLFKGFNSWKASSFISTFKKTW